MGTHVWDVPERRVGVRKAGGWRGKGAEPSGQEGHMSKGPETHVQREWRMNQKHGWVRRGVFWR